MVLHTADNTKRNLKFCHVFIGHTCFVGKRRLVCLKIGRVGVVPFKELATVARNIFFTWILLF